ncbi:DUF3617 domain-containing protein [Erythrobacter sp. SDW2]|uniref:DUF3617 domain-containing protein n=1 Tax=Erythrobacter sp. SDW2 TaxID=2907154 RepID=UPI001F3D4F9A|nr:DUF3617 domain-containing protein [Erythrobacter sp. SDW2]UIP07881.1 DUF3617 domain-containing protein [Erythrobacter sp. SDW2]
MTDADVLAEAGKLANPGPGLYQQTTEIVSAEVPGAAPEQADRLRDQLSGIEKKSARLCVTEEQAAAGFQQLLKEIADGLNGMECGFTAFEASPPRMNATLACTGAGEAKAGLKMAGTTSADGYDVTMDLDASGPHIAGGSMTMRMKVVSQRTGDCPSPGSTELPPEVER